MGDSKDIVLQDTKVSKAVELVLSLAKSKNAKDMLDEENIPVQMQIAVKKIPKNPKQLKLKLPNPIAKPGTDICLFVKDLDKKERDTDPTISHYEDLLAKKGVKNVKEIVPIKALKTDYKPYEAKWNLSNAFDTYLADERIVTCLPRLLGKNFYGRKRAPAQINVLAKDLNAEIEKAINGSKFSFSAKGSTSMALVGHTGMSQESLTANILAAVDQVAASAPGKAANIKQLCIKARACTSIPIYMAEGGPQAIKFPKVKKTSEKVEIDELSTLPDSKVAVYADGRVVVLKDGQSLKEAEKKISETQKTMKRAASARPSRKSKIAKIEAIKKPKVTTIRKLK